MDKPTTKEWEKDLEWILTEWEGKSNPVLAAIRINKRMEELKSVINAALSTQAKEIREESYTQGRQETEEEARIRNSGRKLYQQGRQDEREEIRNKIAALVVVKHLQHGGKIEFSNTEGKIDCECQDNIEIDKIKSLFSSLTPPKK